MGTIIGLVSFGVMLAMISGILRQLGAGGAAKGLIVIAGVLFIGMIFVTYLPLLLSST